MQHFIKKSYENLQCNAYITFWSIIENKEKIVANLKDKIRIFILSENNYLKSSASLGYCSVLSIMSASWSTLIDHFVFPVPSLGNTTMIPGKLFVV